MKRFLKRTARSCSTCAHDGCCADLHYCGGRCWAAAEADDDCEERGEESEPGVFDCEEERYAALAEVWDRMY